MMIFDLILSREQNSNEYQLNMAHDMIKILTEVKTIPLKVIYKEDNTKNIGYVNTIVGTEGRVVTTIKSRLNKKTHVLEEIGRETVTTKAVDTIIIRGTKPKVEIKKPSSLIRFEKRYKNRKVVEKQQKHYSRKRRR